MNNIYTDDLCQSRVCSRLCVDLFIHFETAVKYLNGRGLDYKFKPLTLLMHSAFIYLMVKFTFTFITGME
jgi:hypothetical protein